MPSFYFSGTIIAFVYTFISVLMLQAFGNDLTPLELNMLTFKIMMLEGVGEFLGGLFYIRYADTWAKKKTLLTSNKLFMLAFVLMTCSYFLKNIYLLGAGVVVLGFVDCCSFSLNLAIISEEGWDSFAFSLFNLGQCMGVVISILILMWAPTSAYLMYTFATQLISSFLLHNFKPRIKVNA